MEKMDAENVIDQIAEILAEADGDFIEHIANQVLGRKVVYVEDSFFAFADEMDVEEEEEDIDVPDGGY